MNVAAILADHYDKNAREGFRVSETRATAPVFPPGRYGRRRTPSTRRRVLAVAVAALILAGSALLAVRLHGRYGQTGYDSKIVGWSDVSDSGMTVEFAVNIPRGGTATCVVRARSFDGAEVGRTTVQVPNPGAAAEVRARSRVITTARASHGDVVRCRPS